MTATYPNSPPMPGSLGEKTWLVVAEIATERLRQIDGEGYTSVNDDMYVDGEIARAAGAYALNAAGQNSGSIYFPWPWTSWKPTDPRRDLIKAAALAVAEIERLDRADAAAVLP